MPITDWLKRIMGEKAQDFLIAPLDEKNGTAQGAIKVAATAP